MGGGEIPQATRVNPYLKKSWLIFQEFFKNQINFLDNANESMKFYKLISFPSLDPKATKLHRDRIRIIVILKAERIISQPQMTET